MFYNTSLSHTKNSNPRKPLYLFTLKDYITLFYYHLAFINALLNINLTKQIFSLLFAYFSLFLILYAYFCTTVKEKRNNFHF